MSSTNKTPNLRLSEFLGGDHPAWQEDYNSDMAKIDTAVGEIVTKCDTLDPDGSVSDAGGVAEYVRESIRDIDISLDKVYPVGSVYISMINQSPSDLFGFGTWERVANGRVLVGVDENDSIFQQPGQVGGSKDMQKHTHNGPSHDHSATDLKASTTGGHSHVQHGNLQYELPCASGQTPMYNTRVNGHYHCNPGYSLPSYPQTHAGGSHTHNITGKIGLSGMGATSSTGLGNSQNLQPFLTCYFWSRVA